MAHFLNRRVTPVLLSSYVSVTQVFKTLSKSWYRDLSASRICKFLPLTTSWSVIPFGMGIHGGYLAPEWIPTCVGMT